MTSADRAKAQHDQIRYRKLRAPKLDGQTLQVPPLNEVEHQFRRNLSSANNSSQVMIGTSALADLRKAARQEILELAVAHSKSYLDVEPIDPGLPVVMSGHQPALFHPGVWYKNFVLSSLGRQYQCNALNLVVDNDICGNVAIRYPSFSGATKFGSIPIDRPGPNIPFEERLVADWDYVSEFPKRLQQTNRQWPPIGVELWKDLDLVRDSAKSPSIGFLFAALRHRLEKSHGLQTLELPTSKMSQSHAFANFFVTILERLAEFHTIYNGRLAEYRRVHRIRSRSHPVPDLMVENGWHECPFWVWSKEHPNRARLFARKSRSGKFQLGDLGDLQFSWDTNSTTTQWENLCHTGVAIRPKALTTTMFARLLLSDLFVHGIGGAKYDQLTDAIASDFFKVKLPAYTTMSATKQLPLGRQLVTRQRIVENRQQQRELIYHPEKFLSTNTQQQLVDQKWEWTKGEFCDERSKRKHDAIVDLNSQIRKFTTINLKTLQEQESQDLARLRESEILGSREYSFALFPKSLVDELKALANPR